MKRQILPLLIAGSVCAAEPVFDKYKAEPLPFPSTSERLSTPWTLEEIEGKIANFNSKIGSYPPKFKNEAERKSMHAEWSTALRSTLQLNSISDGKNDERLITALVTLYRQGHNMTVKTSVARAFITIEEALKAYPNSVPLLFEASYLYLQVHPDYVDEGEKVLLRLRELLKTNENVEVEKGLLFAYLFQKRHEDVKKQVEHCMKLDPKDPVFVRISENVTKGNFGETAVKD